MITITTERETKSTFSEWTLIQYGNGYAALIETREDMAGMGYCSRHGVFLGKDNEITQTMTGEQISNHLSKDFGKNLDDNAMWGE